MRRAAIRYFHTAGITAAKMRASSLLEASGAIDL